jgi:hypothetical protein
MGCLVDAAAASLLCCLLWLSPKVVFPQPVVAVPHIGSWWDLQLLLTLLFQLLLRL